MDKCSYPDWMDHLISTRSGNLSFESQLLLRTQMLEKLQNMESNIIWFLVCFFMIVANTLRIVGMNKTNNNTKQTIIKYLFHLTSWVGVFTGVLAITSILGNLFFGCVIEYIGISLERMGVIFDSFVLLCISIIRSISIRYPFKEIRRKWVQIALGVYIFGVFFVYNSNVYVEICDPLKYRNHPLQNCACNACRMLGFEQSVSVLFAIFPSEGNQEYERRIHGKEKKSCEEIDPHKLCVPWLQFTVCDFFTQSVIQNEYTVS